MTTTLYSNHAPKLFVATRKCISNKKTGANRDENVVRMLRNPEIQNKVFSFSA